MFHAERLRVPDLRSSDQGKPGPKDNPKGEADGKRVKIPSPVCTAMQGRGIGDAARRRNTAFKVRQDLRVELIVR
jgi:hypothetical protein